MTNIRRALEAAAAGGGDPVYVEDVFKTLLYTGDGSATRTLTTGLDMSGEGGMVWTDARNNTEDHPVGDTEQGVGKAIMTNNDNIQGSDADWIKSFTSTGYTVGNHGKYNSSYNYVSWSFRKAPGFFDIQKFTATGTFESVSHNLGSVPGFVMYKCLTSESDTTSGDWVCWHTSGSSNNVFFLNTDSGEHAGWGYIGDVFASTVQLYCTSGETYVAYFFATDQADFGADSDQSIIKCGYFDTSSSWGIANAEIGWEPQYLLVKKISDIAGTAEIGDWWVMDSERGLCIPRGAGGDTWSNDGTFYSAASVSDDQIVYPNTTAAENTQGYANPHATGFIAPIGSAQKRYVYVAIRRPMKVPEAGTEVFTPVAYMGAGGSTKNLSLSMNPDVTTIKIRNDTSRSGLIHSRLSDGDFFKTDATAAQMDFSDNIVHFDEANNTIKLPAGSGTNEVNGATSSSYICEAFKRAAGFLDVVTYTGTGVAKTVKHNLTVTPEMMWVKTKDDSRAWAVYSSNDNTKYGVLDTSTGFALGAAYWNSTSPTSTVFTVGTNTSTNGSGDTYMAYLWASTEGVSKVGSYSGTGSNQNINCGFTARYVMVKRFDSGGNWIYLDSARGLTSTPTEPFLRYDETTSEITWDDYVRGHADGFSVIGSNGTTNASGGTYIYLAIA